MKHCWSTQGHLLSSSPILSSHSLTLSSNADIFFCMAVISFFWLAICQHRWRHEHESHTLGRKRQRQSGRPWRTWLCKRLFSAIWRANLCCISSCVCLNYAEKNKAYVHIDKLRPSSWWPKPYAHSLAVHSPHSWWYHVGPLGNQSDCYWIQPYASLDLAHGPQ